MKRPMMREEAKARVTRQYENLYDALMDFVGGLQELEPGGTLIEGVVINRGKTDEARIEYVSRPTMLTVATKERVFVLKVLEGSDWQVFRRERSPGVQQNLPTLRQS